MREPKAGYGLKPFARRRGVITNDLADQLRQDDASSVSLAAVKGAKAQHLLQL